MRTIIINCDPPSVLVPPTPRDVTTSSGDRALFIIINREEPGLCQPLPGHKKSIHNTLISHSHSKMITAGGESIADIPHCPRLHLMLLMRSDLSQTLFCSEF